MKRSILTVLIMPEFIIVAATSGTRSAFLHKLYVTNSLNQDRLRKIVYTLDSSEDINISS